MISCESFMTFLAFKWFFSRVCSLVVLQDVFVSEGSVAHPTREHLLPATRVAIPAPASGPGRGPRGRRLGLSLRGGRGQAPLEVEVGGASPCQEARSPGTAKEVSLITAAAGACASPATES